MLLADEFVFETIKKSKRDFIYEIIYSDNENEFKLHHYKLARDGHKEETLEIINRWILIDIIEIYLTY